MHIDRLRIWLRIFSIVMASIKGALFVIIGSGFSKNRRLYADLVMHTWAREVLRLARVQYSIFNPSAVEFSSDRPYIIMSNHASHFDIPLIFAAFPGVSVRMIAKKELFYIPIFGWGMKIGGCIAIDRKNKRQAIKDLVVAKEEMLSGVRVWIAPEGTRSITGQLGPFKSGGFKIALDIGAIIVPVTIVGSNKILPAKTLDLSLDEQVEIYIGEPIDTANYTNKDLVKLMNKVVDELSKNLDKSSKGKELDC